MIFEHLDIFVNNACTQGLIDAGKTQEQAETIVASNQPAIIAERESEMENITSAPEYVAVGSWEWDGPVVLAQLKTHMANWAGANL